MSRNINIWNRLDKASIIVFFLMIIAGWFNIYAAVYNEEHTGILDMSQRYGKQFIWILATLLIAVFVVVIDTRFYFFFAYFVYGGLIFLLITVLILGKDVNGARSWFQFGPLSLQPSEFAKFGTALALAAYLNSRKHDLMKLPVFMTAIGIIFLPALLIAIQPDLGSTVVYFALFLVLFREGLSPYIFVSVLIMVILFFFTLLFNSVYLTVGVILTSFVLVWVSTRKWKLCLEGFGIFVVATFILYTLNDLLFETLSEEYILFLAVILSGIAYAFYFYSKRPFLY